MPRCLAAVLAICAACGSEGEGTARSESPPDSSIGAAAISPATGSIDVIPINSGTQGMRSTVRWMLSPDRRAILAVEDPVSVEAEALPNGFLYASERTGAIVQIDSVWDVAPSPDWSRLAFGRAFILRAGERDTMPSTEWERLEAWLPEDVAARDRSLLRRRLEAHAFPASGMSLMLGLGLTQVMWLDSLDAGRATAPRGPTHSLHGWRVRWTPGGDTLAVGAAPTMVQDDSPPARWVLVRARRWASPDSLAATTDSSRFARLAWTRGPTMELASAIDLSPIRPLTIAGGTIDVRGDSIRLTTRSTGGTTAVRVIGPGVPLAATATGRFVLALVPRARGRAGEMAARPVVYSVRPQ